MTANSCRMCHNTSFHYSPEQSAIICDICGTPVQGLTSPTEELEYQRNRNKAIAYIKANDYNAAVGFLNAMKAIKPDDPDIYYLHLMGLTDKRTNLLLSPSDRGKVTQVQSYWQTFNNLGGDTSSFVSYGRRRKDAVIKLTQERIKQAQVKIGVYAGAILLCLLVSLFGAIHSWMYLFLLLMTLPIYSAVKSRVVHDLIQDRKMLNLYQIVNDPFFDI